MWFIAVSILFLILVIIYHVILCDGLTCFDFVLIIVFINHVSFMWIFDQYQFFFNRDRYKPLYFIWLTFSVLFLGHGC